MFQNLDMFKTAISMARHAGLKQAVTSQNVANADTPRYLAQSVDSFADLVPSQIGGLALKATRSTHFGARNTAIGSQTSLRTNSEPNGNSVVLENEILNSVDAKRQHDRALAVYRASLSMMRSALSKQ